MAIPLSYRSYSETVTYRPGNGCVQVYIFLRYSSEITRALFDAPLNELLRLHQLPPDSTTLESFNTAMESLGGLDEDVKRRILCLIRQQCNVLVAERPVSSSRAMAIRIYADFCSNYEEEEINALEEALIEEFGSVKFRAAEEEGAEKLERFVFGEDNDVDDDDDDRETCAVCMDDMEPGDRGARIPCGHVYHEDCIVKWLGVSCSCPICRFQLA